MKKLRDNAKRAPKNSGSFHCDICGTYFSSRSNLARHTTTSTHEANQKNMKAKNSGLKHTSSNSNSPLKVNTRSITSKLETSQKSPLHLKGLKNHNKTQSLRQNILSKAKKPITLKFQANSISSPKTEIHRKITRTQVKSTSPLKAKNSSHLKSLKRENLDVKTGKRSIVNGLINSSLKNTPRKVQPEVSYSPKSTRKNSSKIIEIIELDSPAKKPMKNLPQKVKSKKKKSDQSLQNELTCYICERLFKHRKYLRKHMINIHKIDPRKTSSPKENSSAAEIIHLDSSKSLENSEIDSNDLSSADDKIFSPIKSSNKKASPKKKDGELEVQSFSEGNSKYSESMYKSDQDEYRLKIYNEKEYTLKVCNEEEYTLKDFSSSFKTECKILDKYPYLETALPKLRNSKIHFSSIDPSCKSWFRVKLEFPCKNITDVDHWIKIYESLNGIKLERFETLSMRLSASQEDVLYKGNFRCNYSSSDKNHTPCPARVFITVNSVPTFTPNAILKIKHTHNHTLPDGLELKVPTDDVKEKFVKLFTDNYSVSEALAFHSKDLQAEFGDNYDWVIQDRRIMPHPGWCYYLYYSMHLPKETKEGYLEPVKYKTNEPLEETIRKFKEMTEDIINRSYIEPAVIQPILQECLSCYDSNIRSGLIHLNGVYK